MADSKSMVIVPLSGSNYGTWKVQCRMALMKDSLWGIVSGSETAPSQADVDKYAKFVNRRNRALAIIVLAVDTSLLYLLGDPEDPEAVWKKLMDQFQKKTWANKLALRRRLNNLRLREGGSVKEHVKAMTEIFNELAVIGAPMEDEDKVVTLLASLPESFDMLVTALEANTDVPEMEVVTERLFHYERKLNEQEIVSPKPESEKVMLGNNSKGPKCYQCGNFGHIKRFCTDLDKSKRQENKQSKPRKHKANTVKEHSDSDSAECLGLVTQALAADVCDKSSELWIVDSGATCHMCKNKNLFNDFVELTNPAEVQLGDGKVLNATGRGTVTVFTVLAGGKHKKCELRDVLFVPKLSYNLLSVAKATEAGCFVNFEGSVCKISRGGDGVTIAVANKVGCLYHLDFKREIERSSVANASREMLWHQRYGHLGAPGMKKLAADELVTGFDFNPNSDLDFCEACVNGKLHRCSFPTGGAKRAHEPLGLVHSDLCGKITPKSSGGAEYFLTLTDDKTRYVWVYVLKTKDETFTKFCEWKASVENSSGYKLKTLRTDNGGEYVSNEFKNFLKAEGVRHELTVPKTPQQNGVAERLNRTLVESVRSMLVQAKLPQKFWVEAINTAVYLRNRSPTKAVDGATPFEAWTEVKPDVTHLRSFGCTAYAHIPKDERKKLDSKARKCVFLGYGSEIKGYRLYDCERQRVIYSRDVKFNENEFGIQKEAPDGVDEKLVTIELSNNDDVAEDMETAAPRQSARVRRPPIRLGEWVTVASEDATEPTTVREALSGSDAEQWHDAMEQEMDSLDKHGVWNLTKLPDRRKAIGSKWVFRVKHNVDGSVERHKARLVAQGFSQKYGVDYDETFSPVVRFESLRTLIALSVQRGLKLHQMDVNTAFLNGELEEEVYMRQPEGFVVKEKEHLVCKLNKSLYGLKQSPRCWNYILDEHLQSMGFVQTPSDPCIYVAEGHDPFIIAVYVDDIILAGTTDVKIAEVKQSIADRFEVKDMGELKFFLGVQIIQQSGKIWMGQSTYAENVLKKFGMENAKPVATPADSNSKLVKAEELDSELHNQAEYQSAVGSLMYLSCATRPDITFAVSNVAKFSANPTEEHWTAVKRIFRYLKGTVSYGLQYSSDASSECV